MDAGAIVLTLSRALELLRAGEPRKARARLAPLGADLVGGAPLPRAAWVVRLIELGRVDEAQAELEALLAGAQDNRFALAPTDQLLQAAHAIFGPAGLAAAGVCSPHEIAGLVTPGAPLPNEALLRQRLLVLLAAAPRAA